MVANYGVRSRACTIRLLQTFGLMILLLPAAGIQAEERPTAPAGLPQPVHQLRIYQIFDGNKGAFHDRFRDHAARIMARYEFPIVAMWETSLQGRTEFVYLLEWPDEQTMKDRWKQFMADEEWSRIKRETGAAHGALVGDIEDRTLRLTDYSPGRRLLQGR